MNSNLNNCKYFFYYCKFFNWILHSRREVLEGTKTRTMISAEKPKLNEKWQPCMNKNDEMTK